MPEQEKRILVVDNNKTNLLQAEELLSSQYTVRCEVSGSEALDYLQTNTPDLILLDLYMPDMNGLEIMAQLRRIDSCRNVPVIFLTADTAPDTEVAILKAGAMDYIRKPFIPEVVLWRIGRILAMYDFQQTLQQEVDKTTAQLRQSTQRVRALSDQIIHTLANAIDAKDTYTRGHSVRVAKYSRQIALRMGKSDQEAENIFYSGLLHDIGKIGIPDTIINKDDRLADREYAVMKAHPAIGADILKDMTEIPDAAVGAHWHHERYDGTGYPDGLTGSAIPETARIIGVADAYDAMTSRRCYQDVLPQQVVRKEIARGRGTQFDPDITDIMLDMIDEDPDYLMREM
jgi:putative two-component system response regulator